MNVTSSSRVRWTLSVMGRMATGVLMMGLCSCAGAWDHFDLFKPKIPDEVESDNLVLGAEGLVADTKVKTTTPDDSARAMVAARELFRKEEYEKAEPLFTFVAEKEKNPAPLVQEAMYYRGECLRLTGYYPKAGDVYSGLLGKFPNTPYREQCVQHMFDIANFLLEDTRRDARAEGKGRGQALDRLAEVY